MSDLLRVALRYASLGYPVFPLQPGDKRPATKHGCKDASTDPDAIRKMFSGRKCNIGIATAGLCVVDLDPGNEFDLSSLPPDAPRQKTPRGGWHILMRQNGTPIPSKTNALGAKVDTRGEGGYVVAYPSVVNGKPYRWQVTPGHRSDLPPHRDKLPVVPDSTVARLQENKPRPAPQEHKPMGHNRVDAVERCWRYVQKMPDAISGQGGHDATLSAACKCYQFGLSDAEAREIMRRFNGLKTGDEQWSEKELDHKLVDARKKVEDAGEFGSMLRDDRVPRKTWSAVDWDAPVSVDDPHRLARLYLKELQGDYRDRTLHYYLGEYLRYDGWGYRVAAPEEIRAELTRLAKREFDTDAKERVFNAKTAGAAKKIRARKVTRNIISNITNAVDSETLIPGTTTLPAWHGKEDGSPTDLLVTKGGILELSTGRKIPNTPRLITTNVLPYAHDPSADCPAWLEFLGTILGTDGASIDCLQEWFGYCLLASTGQHRMLMMIGPPRSGKGTIGRVLGGVIGANNLCSPTLGSLSGPFGLWPMVGKLVALVADARLSGRADAVAVVERLLSISGEDPQDIARKNLPTLAGVRLPTRFVLMTNELPKLRDASGALLTRVILLRLTKSFVGCEDRTLGDRLDRELPGILNWAIAGRQRLEQRGYFVQPESGQELLDDLTALSSPISAFVGDRCELGAEYSTPIAELFGAWREWCVAAGRDHPGTMQSFGRDLRARFPQLRVIRPRTSDGGRERWYEGIMLQMQL